MLSSKLVPPAEFPKAVEDPHCPGCYWDADRNHPNALWFWNPEHGWDLVAKADLPTTPEHVVLWVALQLEGL